MLTKLAETLKWIKENWNTLAMLLVLVAGWFHLNLKIEKGPPGSDPGIVIILPESGPVVFHANGPKGTNERIIGLVQMISINPELLGRAESAIKD